MSSASVANHRRLVLRSLSVLLGLFFILVGWLKLSPYLSRDLHKDLRSEYNKYARAFGLAASSKFFRKSFGSVELVCGLVFVLLPHRATKNLANVVLLVSKLVVLWAQVRLDEAFERLAPTLVFGLMLLCRGVVDFQVHRRAHHSIRRDATEDPKLEDRKLEDPKLEDRPDDEMQATLTKQKIA